MLRLNTFEFVNGLFWYEMQHIHETCVRVYVAQQHIVGVFVFIFMQICSKYWSNDVNDDDDDDRHHHRW